MWWCAAGGRISREKHREGDGESKRDRQTVRENEKRVYLGFQEKEIERRVRR
jgi:hypothetical protein